MSVNIYDGLAGTISAPLPGTKASDGRDVAPVTAAAFHGSLGDPDYHTLHPGNAGKGLDQNGRGTWMGSPDYTAEEHKAALEYYTQEGSLEMNAYLRDGSLPRGGTEEDAKRNTRTLNDLIQIQDPLTEPVTVYRGGPDLDLSPGDEITDRGFISNSDEESIADAFALGYLIRDGVQGQTYTVTIPAGARVLSVWGVDPAIDNESEWVLPPGTRMRAVSPTELEVIVD